MGYTALYRKFRPIKFSEIVGQEHIKKTLKNQLISDRVGHAYLFNGGRGTGKTTTAKILARAVNCLNPKDGEPCNECEICKGALSGSLTDIIEMDAASNNSVEDVRSIREAVNFLPTKAKYRVYIIDEVHMLSTGAFNALLKTLEEPPEHVKFILATTEPQKLPATILSRCQRFDFKRISDEDIVKDLRFVCKESDIKITDEALNLIAVLAEGGMRDALSILERCNQEGTDEINEDKVKDLVGIPKTVFINKIVDSVINENVEETLNTLQEVINEGKDINNLVWEIIKYIKDILLYKSTGKTEIYNQEEIENIKKISDKISKQELINLICELSEIENSMKISTQKAIILQTGLIKLCNKQEISTKTTNIEGEMTKNSDLERRVTKIENFLRASNFAKAGDSKPKYSVQTSNVNLDETNVVEQKPKYQGKTQDYWPKLVEDFKTNGKMFMYINLAGTIAREVNDMTLEIEFPNGMNNVAKEFLSRPDTKQNLRETIHLACGKEMQIRFADDKGKSEKSENEFEKFIETNDLPFNII
jgi:DNA polymerase-3 subunit gamma/tau